jgi:hypothetical protein
MEYKNLCKLINNKTNDNIDINFINSIPNQLLNKWCKIIYLLELPICSKNEDKIFIDLLSRYKKYYNNEINNIIEEYENYKNKIINKYFIESKKLSLLISIINSSFLNDYNKYIKTVINDKYIIELEKDNNIIKCILYYNNKIIEEYDNIFKEINYFHTDKILINIYSFIVYGYKDYKSIHNYILINFSIPQYITLNEFIKKNNLELLINYNISMEELLYHREQLIITKYINNIILGNLINNDNKPIYNFNYNTISNIKISLKKIDYDEIYKLYDHYKNEYLHYLIGNID